MKYFQDKSSISQTSMSFEIKGNNGKNAHMTL